MSNNPLQPECSGSGKLLNLSVPQFLFLSQREQQYSVYRVGEDSASRYLEKSWIGKWQVSSVSRSCWWKRVPLSRSLLMLPTSSLGDLGSLGSTQDKIFREIKMSLRKTCYPSKSIFSLQGPSVLRSGAESRAVIVVGVQEKGCDRRNTGQRVGTPRPPPFHAAFLHCSRFLFPLHGVSSQRVECPPQFYTTVL